MNQADAPGRPLRVVCAGRLYCDLIFAGLAGLPRAGREVFAESASLHAGGGAFITAATLAALGARVDLLATLPAEPFGGLVAGEIASCGVALCDQPPVPPTEPQITAAMIVDGDRAFLTRRTGSAIPCLPLGEMAADHLHIGELTTALEHPELLSAARTAGMTISLDCGWDDANASRDGVAEAIAGVDVFLPNAAEVMQLADTLRTVHPRQALVVKKGALGAEAHTELAQIVSKAHPANLVDTTGAGDAFNAGFLSLWLQGRNLAACLDAGNASGARAVGHVGGVQPRSAPSDGAACVSPETTAWQQRAAPS